jgi:hypothetical protein
MAEIDPHALIHFQPGMRLLLQGYDYAAELGRDRWDFAVEYPALRLAGLSTNDLRWLVYRGFAEHAREISRHFDPDRRFQPVELLTASKRTCVVLTEAGAQIFRGMASQDYFADADIGETTEPNGQLIHAAVHRDGNGHACVEKPKWDRDRQQLRWGNIIVKEFKLPSPNQERILAAFEEEEWPCRIDDPLPPHPDIEPKRRLNGTITSLNRNQKSRQIRFLGDGSGQGICWKPVAEKSLS